MKKDDNIIENLQRLENNVRTCIASCKTLVWTDVLKHEKILTGWNKSEQQLALEIVLFIVVNCQKINESPQFHH